MGWENIPEQGEHRIIPVPCVGRFPGLGYGVGAPPAAGEAWVVHSPVFSLCSNPPPFGMGAFALTSFEKRGMSRRDRGNGAGYVNERAAKIGKNISKTGVKDGGEIRFKYIT